MPSDPAKYRASILFRRFFALVGRPPRGDARRDLRPSRMSLVCSLYNGCVIARGGFGGLAFDSMPNEGAVAGASRLLRCPHPHRDVNWSYSKIPNRNSTL